MNKIVFPLEPHMQGPTVVDLQDGLLFLFDKGLLLRENEAARRELAQALKQERERQAFTGATSKLVGIFQKEHGLPPTGEVDERTAAALNKDIFQEEVLPAPEFPYLVPGQGWVSSSRRETASRSQQARFTTLSHSLSRSGSRFSAICPGMPPTIES